MTLFNVSIHDVTPAFAPQLRAIVEAMEPLVGRSLAMAVVPRWHGRAPESRDESFWGWVQDHASEILLHGYEHVQPRFSGVAGVCKANEMRGLSPPLARERLKTAQGELQSLVGAPALGFLAPAYERGGATDEVLADCGLSYCLGWSRLTGFDGSAVPLATWVWDVAPVRGAGYLGEILGYAASIARSRAVPAVAIHPQDVDRGYLSRCVGIVRRLVSKGLRPVTPIELLGSSSPGGH